MLQQILVTIVLMQRVLFCCAFANQRLGVFVSDNDVLFLLTLKAFLQRVEQNSTTIALSGDELRRLVGRFTCLRLRVNLSIPMLLILSSLGSHARLIIVGCDFDEQVRHGLLSLMVSIDALLRLMTESFGWLPLLACQLRVVRDNYCLAWTFG